MRLAAPCWCFPSSYRTLSTLRWTSSCRALVLLPHRNRCRCPSIRLRRDISPSAWLQRATRRRMRHGVGLYRYGGRRLRLRRRSGSVLLRLCLQPLLLLHLAYLGPLPFVHALLNDLLDSPLVFPLSAAVQLGENRDNRETCALTASTRIFAGADLTHVFSIERTPTTTPPSPRARSRVGVG